MRTFSDAFVIRDPEAERVDGHTGDLEPLHACQCVLHSREEILVNPHEFEKKTVAAGL